MSSNESSTLMTESEELFLASKFESYDDLLESIRAFYRTKGYGLTIRDSQKDKYVTFQCDRSGTYRDTRGIAEKRKKSTGTRLTDCPFRVGGKKGCDNLWVLKAKKLTHNHVPSTDVSGHPSFRRLPSDNVECVKNMTLSGIPPRQILCALRQQNQNLTTTSRTIYNLKAKLRKEDLSNRSKIGALFEELAKADFSYDILHDSEGHITHLFIVHPLSIKLAKVFSNTFVMDCTYKTNKFNMPLLDIVGVSCFNTSFYSGFAFLEREDEESYIWALSAFKKILGHGNEPSVILTDRELALMNGLKNVFPNATNLLCIWHIEKNVLANCKKYYECSDDFDMFMLDWKNVVYSTTEPLFEKIWARFEILHKEKKEAIEYLKKTWLPWKDKFVSAWTEKYLHFGNRSSSRAEGAHSKLKKYLQVSTGGFQEVKDKICLAVQHEFNEIKVKLASEKIRVLHNCNIPLFRELLYRLSHFALAKIYEQYKKSNDGTMSPCTGHYMATMGLPCAHQIRYCRESKLSLDLIHPHWRIDALSLNPEDDTHHDDTHKFNKILKELSFKYQAWPLQKKEYVTSVMSNFVNDSDAFFEPVIQKPKGRPPKSKKKKGITSTTRDPSRFEIVESSRTHTPSTSYSTLQLDEPVAEENNDMLFDDLIDLNAYPDFSSHFMSL